MARKARPAARPAARKRPAPASQRVFDAALELAVESGWQHVTLAGIAERAKLSLAEVHAVAPNRAAVIRGLIADIDRQVLQGGAPDAESSPRDRLFDLLMRRFDALSSRRAGIVALMKGCRADPLALLCTAPQVVNSMALMLEMAGISTGGLRGMLRVHGLAAVAANAFRTWLLDDSPDMAKTMAALDKGLARAETVAGWLSGIRGHRRGHGKGSEEAAQS